MRKMPTKEVPNIIKKKDGKVICSEHGEEEVGMYCKQCGALVCSGCIEIRHRSHDILSVKSQALEDRKTLMRLIPGIKQNVIPSLRDNIKVIKESRDSTKAEFGKLIEQINERSLELIKEIRIVRDHMIQDCKSNQEKTTAFLNETEAKILNGIHVLEKSMKSCEDVLRHERADRNSEIVLERIELDSTLEEYPNKSPKLGFPVFQAGLSDENVMKHMFGGFRGNFKYDFDPNIPFRKYSAMAKKLKPNIVSSFKYKTDIRAMCIVDTNSVWLAPINQYNELVKVDRTGRELERRNTSFQVYDIAITNSQILLATNAVKKSLMQITEDGIQKEVADLPLRPRGLYACKNGDILLCLCDAVDFPIHKDGKRQVVRMDKDYVIKLTIESYEGGRLFTLPDRVAENVNGDICVIDRTGGGNSHLCVFSSIGKFRYSYPDISFEQQEQAIPGHALKKHSFRDVCCDSLGNIIISDEKSSEIIVLTKHGGRKCLLTNRLQRAGLNLTPHFYRPSSLGLDSDGKLWVLQKQGITVVDLYSQWMPTVPRPPLIANMPR
jgi:hypothetical protein